MAEQEHLEQVQMTLVVEVVVLLLMVLMVVQDLDQEELVVLVNQVQLMGQTQQELAVVVEP